MSRSHFRSASVPFWGEDCETSQDIALMKSYSGSSLWSISSFTALYFAGKQRHVKLSSWLVQHKFMKSDWCTCMAVVLPELNLHVTKCLLPCSTYNWLIYTQITSSVCLHRKKKKKGNWNISAKAILRARPPTFYLHLALVYFKAAGATFGLFGLAPCSSIHVSHSSQRGSWWTLIGCQGLTVLMWIAQ